MLRLGYELVLTWLMWVYWSDWRAKDRLLQKIQRERPTRQRHPQSPHDCPVCRAGHEECICHEQPVIEAWSKQKSKRGRPKVIATEGDGCPHPVCGYYGITDCTGYKAHPFELKGEKANLTVQGRRDRYRTGRCGNALLETLMRSILIIVVPISPDDCVQGIRSGGWQRQFLMVIS
jgi:hypothetical protein